tara:strand:+ start:10706 stop:11383 length:678 start_codon:yes stop_codon:yes gene_type:complete
MNLEKLRDLVNEMCDACDAKEKHARHDQNPKQGKMARTDLVTIAKDAHELMNMFGDDADLPEWVESKITKAADYLNSVRKYIGGEIVRQQNGLMEDKVNNHIFFRDIFEYQLREGEERYMYIDDAIYEDGSIVEEDLEFWEDTVMEAEYQGRKVSLNKPMRGDVKKFKVFVKDPKTGNVKKVNFGDPNMRIKKSNPKRRKSFRARHNCDNPGPKTKARYWSCRKW